MKPNFLWLVVAGCCVGSIFGTSCSDDLSELGSTTRPSTDGVTIKSKTFNLSTRTAYRDSIYVRTGYPLLGDITDPDFGKVTAGYLAQFYVSSEFGLTAYDNSDSIIFNPAPHFGAGPAGI